MPVDEREPSPKIGESFLARLDPDQAVQENVFQAPAAVENRQNQDIHATSAVDQTVGRDDQLAILSNMQASQLGHDAPPVNLAGQGLRLALETIEGAERSPGAAVGQIGDDRLEITAR
jgi:hypothetical protein